MLLFLMFSLLAGSVLLLLIRHDRESVLLFFLVASMMLFILAMLIFIAKKGGINAKVSFLLFGLSAVRESMQFLTLTLGSQSFFVAVGRYTAPLFFLWIAFYYNEDINFMNIKKYSMTFSILPVCFLVMSIPAVFEHLIAQNPLVLKINYYVSLLWIILYVIISLFVMIMEYRKITIRWFKKLFIQKALLPFSLSIVYVLFCLQDPSQILLFYHNEFMQSRRVWYLSTGFNAPLFLGICLLMIFCETVSFLTLLHYTQLSWDEEKEEAILKKKAHAIAGSVNIIVHGIKNDLLVNNIIIKRLERQLDLPACDREQMLLFTRQLRANNDGMTSRIKQLYTSMQNQALCFRLVPLQEVINDAIRIFHGKYPEGMVTQREETNLNVLCDRYYLCEAFSNILLNGWEATFQTGKLVPVEITVREERNWTAIHITDHGSGIPKKLAQKLYEPFVSSKSSSTNWGMGMYYVRSIVQDHLGTIHFESGAEGTTFYVLLPRIRRKINEQDSHSSC